MYFAKGLKRYFQGLGSPFTLLPTAQFFVSLLYIDLSLLFGRTPGPCIHSGEYISTSPPRSPPQEIISKRYRYHLHHGLDILWIKRFQDYSLPHFDFECYDYLHHWSKVTTATMLLDPTN